MKNGTEVYLIGLVLLVAGVFAWSFLSGQQVDLAAAQVNAEVATGKLPMAAVIGGQVSGWAIKTIIGMVAVAVAAVVVAYTRQWWKARNGKRAWRSGPNAQWKGQERAPRQHSDNDLVREYLYLQLMAQKQNPNKRQPALPLDDDLDIEF